MESLKFNMMDMREKDLEITLNESALQQAISEMSEHERSLLFVSLIAADGDEVESTINSAA